MAIQALTGGDFLGRPVERQTSVLYIDAELDAEEFGRRAYQIARGLGLTGPPEGLYYWRLPGSLKDQGVQAEVYTAVIWCNPSLIVIDSITVAASGTDVSKVEITTELMSFLGGLGATVLAVDHVAKPAPGTNPSELRPFGSVFKFNLARSVIHVLPGKAGALRLRQTKSNFGPVSQSVGAAVEFADSEWGPMVTVTQLKDDDPRLDSADVQVSAEEEVWRVLAQLGPSKPDAIGELLDMSEKTVRNHLTSLRKAERVVALGDGRWFLPRSSLLWGP